MGREVILWLPVDAVSFQWTFGLHLSLEIMN